MATLAHGCKGACTDRQRAGPSHWQDGRCDCPFARWSPSKILSPCASLHRQQQVSSSKTACVSHKFSSESA
eukprot:3662726-Rhodomonas_salina.2